MDTKYFVAGVVGLMGGATIIKGAMGRGSVEPKKRAPSLPYTVTDPETVFQEEIDKFKKWIDPRELGSFDIVLKRFEEGLVELPEHITKSLVQSLLVAVLAKNSLEGVSNYFPKGIAFDSILNCELDSISILAEKGGFPEMVGKVGTLYTYLK